MTKNKTDIQISIVGSAGDGTIAAGDILRKVMAEIGYRVISFDFYPPEIRGFGKCIARLRVTDEQSYSLKAQSEILVSLDDSHAIPHVGEAKAEGIVIYETESIAIIPEGSHISGYIDPAQFPYPLAMRALSEKTTASPRSRNIVLIGYLAGLYDLPMDSVMRAFESKFGKKPAVLKLNEAAIIAGYEVGRNTYRLDDIAFYPPTKSAMSSKTEMISGNNAIARGAIDAKINTFFGYPITPATSIMEKLVIDMPKNGNKLVQMEDEISAIAATIGAGYTGARSATATSGPGFSLMSEMIGLAVIAEVPCVIFVSQRGGPSTGMPTKTEQSDLNIAIYGGHGDAPRIVIAPTNVEGCYRCAGKAFEIAETYQVPVIVLIDLYLSNRYETVPFDNNPPFINNMNKNYQPVAGEKFLRYQLTEDHISPRAVAGQKEGIHTITGLEHNELGRPDDSARMHTAMNKKRHEKLKSVLTYPDITSFKRFGDEGKVDIGLISWGSSFGECLEAMYEAQKEGIKVAAFKVVILSPFPTEQVKEFIKDCKNVLVPELNFQGQFANLLQAHTAIEVNRLSHTICAPLRVADILEEISRITGKSKRKKAA